MTTAEKTLIDDLLKSSGAIGTTDEKLSIDDLLAASDAIQTITNRLYAIGEHDEDCDDGDDGVIFRAKSAILMISLTQANLTCVSLANYLDNGDSEEVAINKIIQMQTCFDEMMKKAV